MPTEISRFLKRDLHWNDAASMAWVAGLIEGDGCITTQRGYPVVEVAMTDEDVVRRFASILDAPVWGPYPRPGRWSAIWKSRVTGIDRLTDLYIRLEPFLGARRRGRFQEVLLGRDEEERVGHLEPQLWQWSPWAAGIFEAEGCISLTARSPGLILECRDKDAVLRFAGLVGGPVLGPYRRGLTRAGKPRPPTYRWQVSGLAPCVTIATRLRPWLGDRRRSRLRELIHVRRDMKGARHALDLQEQLWDQALAGPWRHQKPWSGPCSPRNV